MLVIRLVFVNSWDVYSNGTSAGSLGALQRNKPQMASVVFRRRDRRRQDSLVGLVG